MLVKTGPKYTRSIIDLKSKPITADSLIPLDSLKPLIESWSLSTSSSTLTIKKKKKGKDEGNHHFGVFLQVGDERICIRTQRDYQHVKNMGMKMKLPK